MINFRKTIATSLMFASIGMGVAATSTPAAAFEFQHRVLSSGFSDQFRAWGPGIGGVPVTNTYNVYNPCYLTNQAIVDDYGFTYYSTARLPVMPPHASAIFFSCAEVIDVIFFGSRKSSGCSGGVWLRVTPLPFS
jgi:hypothetical protein